MCINITAFSLQRYLFFWGSYFVLWICDKLKLWSLYHPSYAILYNIGCISILFHRCGSQNSITSFSLNLIPVILSSGWFHIFLPNWRTLHYHHNHDWDSSQKSYIILTCPSRYYQSPNAEDLTPNEDKYKTE